MQQTVAPLVVGSRVRIGRLSECRVVWPPREIPLPNGHPAAFEGILGTVVRIQTDDGTGHTMHVPFDAALVNREAHPAGFGCRSRAPLWHGGSFAPAELAPL